MSESTLSAMLNQKCQHKEWQLVKIRGVRDFKIWQCRQCNLLLKERTKGSHEVFVIKSSMLQSKVLSSKKFSSKTQKVFLFLAETGGISATALADSCVQASKHN